jgi:acetolactate synthase I/II/III large subunit
MTHMATEVVTKDVSAKLADLLVDAGVTTGFCVQGDGNLDLMACMAQVHGAAVVNARHEQGAVAMADGYARFADGIGFASVTAGAGLTNAATSILEAVAARSPVLLVAPDSQSGTLTQTGFLASLGCRVQVIGAPRELAEQWPEVLAYLHVRRGPLALSIPSSVLRAPASPADRQAAAPAAGSIPAGAAPDRAAEWLSEARRPALLAGHGLGSGPRARRLVAELAEALGAPVVTTLKASGLLYGHPLALGAIGELGSPDANAALSAADCVISLGASLSPWATNGGELLAGSRLVRVENDSEVHLDSNTARFVEADLTIAEDAVAVLDGILARTRSQDARDPWWEGGPQAGEDTPALSSGQTASGLLDPRAVLLALDQALPEQRVVVLDGGHLGTFAAQILRSTDPRGYAYAYHCGAIGQALPIAIGATFARPEDRTVVVAGDGGFAMAIADLATAVRYSRPLTVIVLNDEGFGQERINLRARRFDQQFSDHPSGDIAAVARAFGYTAHQIHDDAGLAGLPGLLTRSAGPVLIEARVDPHIINPAAVKIAERFRARL